MYPNLSLLTKVVPPEILFWKEEVLKQYGSDETEDLCFPPHVVAKPTEVSQIVALLQFANEHQIPITPIGARTGLSGGALSVYGGIGLSMEKMNRILHIDTDNLQVMVEPGVITQVLQDEVAKYGLFYPVDPSSKGSCSIGGNVAENAGGARAVKYGVTKDFVLNLEVVLPDGSVHWTGANTLKNATGYNLTQLMVGSEGTLGVITKIVLKLIPAVSSQILMLVPFYKMDEACQAVAAIFKAGIIPSALEFMEKDALDWSIQHLKEDASLVKDNHQAHLLIELDGNDQDYLMKQAEALMPVLESFSIDEILFADTEDAKNSLWKLRRKVAEAVKSNSVYKEEDTVVPRFSLPELLLGVKAIGKKYGFQSVCYGHAGDGNLHINIVKGNLSEEAWKNEVPKGIQEIMELTVQLGGTLSGEHGIGWVQKNYMPIAFSPLTIQLMKGIKKVFDPKGIMNPGKVFPDEGL